MVFYTNKIIPKRFAGYFIGPLIFIRPEYKNDVGLLEHEKTHVRQWYARPVLMPVRYKYSKKWRLRYEVEAYKVQLQYNPLNTKLFAQFLAEKHGLDITRQDAEILLKGGC